MEEIYRAKNSANGCILSQDGPEPSPATNLTLIGGYPLFPDLFGAVFAGNDGIKLSFKQLDSVFQLNGLTELIPF